jgi:phosphonoacetate hydrolase
MTTLDQLLSEAKAAAPDAAFLLTADHGMNYKSRCWNLFKACRELGSEVRFALSAEKDRYVKHHRTFGGAAWVWLKSPKDESKVAATLMGLKGVEAVLPRRDAAAKFGLMPERIGELAVFGHADTVFGELEGPMEELERGYRSHGSLHESDIPLVIYYNSSVDPSPAGGFYRQSRPHAPYRRLESVPIVPSRSIISLRSNHWDFDD